MGNKISDKEQQKIEEADGFHISPDEADYLLKKIINDPLHPYYNDKAKNAEREKANALVLRLYEIKAGKEFTLKGYLVSNEKSREQRLDDMLDIQMKS